MIAMRVPMVTAARYQRSCYARNVVDVRSIAIVVWGLGMAAACGPKAGSTGSGSSDEDSGAVSSGATTDDGIVGTWVGYADGGGAVPSGSDRVELRITAIADDGEITGTIAFGEPTALPPAANPAVGYPPELGGAEPSLTLYDGFAYALSSGVYDDDASRMQAELHTGDLWSGWCALQTSYQTSEDSYGCLPNCGFMSSDRVCSIPDDCPSIPGPIDCGKLVLCNPPGVCRCTATGCTNATGSALTLDLHRDGDDLQGPIDLLGTAFLTRQ